MFLFILFPGVAHSGTKQGIDLFSNTLFPYLLPYLILTNWILLLSKNFSTSTYFTYIKCYVLSAIGGYPVGAIIIDQLLANKELTKREAAFLLPICHHPSPIFILGFVSNFIVSDPFFGWSYLILIHSFSILLLMIFCMKFKRSSNPIVQAPVSASFSASMQNTMQPLFLIASTIIFFCTVYSVTLHLFNLFFQGAENSYFSLVGTLLELTNGLVLLKDFWQGDNFLLLVVILLTTQSFSIHVQVFAVIKQSALSLKPYFIIRAFYSLVIPVLYFFLFN